MEEWSMIHKGRVTAIIVPPNSLLHSHSTNCHYCGTGRYRNMAQRQTQCSV